jgi:epoxyqueuosine reductase
MSERQEELRRRLEQLGFDEVRFAQVDDATPGRPALDAWLAAGMHGEMAWMERTAEKRRQPDQVLPGVKSIIMLGVSYADEAAQNSSHSAKPLWARYALHEDYHDTIKPALVAAGKLIEELCAAEPSDYRYYVDTGPVLERGWAARAGLGFTGKNAMLISRTHGNWLFLAGILTRVEFAPDSPIRKKALPAVEERTADVGLLCGKCTRCIDACPTRAFAAPGVVDARRCVSYQTIENKGIIPRELRRGIGARVYGCDVCLEVCPWNRFAKQGRRMLLKARSDLARLSTIELLRLTPETFAEIFRGTPMKRVKLGGLLRNACIVAGNTQDPSLLPDLIALASHPLSLVRAHAVWAVYRLAGAAAARNLLVDARAKENEPAVLAEYEAAEKVTAVNEPPP